MEELNLAASLFIVFATCTFMIALCWIDMRRATKELHEKIDDLKRELEEMKQK